MPARASRSEATDNGRVKRSGSRSIAAIILAHNPGAILIKCLESVQNAEITEVILINNGRALVAKELPTDWKDKIGHRLRKTRNFGFGAACNHASKLATAEYLLFVNPDAVLESKSAVIELATALTDHPEAKLVGGAVLSENAVVDPACARPLPNFSQFLFSSRKRKSEEKYAAIRQKKNGYYAVPAISGAFFMMRREDFFELGGFDERFFLHFEDLDLCARVSRSGAKILFVPTARVTHAGGSSEVANGQIRYHKGRSLAIFLSKKTEKPVAAYFWRFCQFPIAVAALLFYK